MNSSNTEVIVDEYIDIPELEYEEILAEPSGYDDVWISGYWERDPDEWTWAPGRWEKPPHKKARWKDGHWKLQDDKWHWNRGTWAVDEYDGYFVDELVDIPATLSEDIPTRPSKKDHWVAGYWEWDGYWFWVSGYWTSKWNPKAEWVAGHWNPCGDDGWRWISGHWSVRD